MNTFIQVLKQFSSAGREQYKLLKILFFPESQILSFDPLWCSQKVSTILNPFLNFHLFICVGTIALENYPSLSLSLCLPKHTLNIQKINFQFQKYQKHFCSLVSLVIFFYTKVSLSNFFCCYLNINEIPFHSFLPSNSAHSYFTVEIVKYEIC